MGFLNGDIPLTVFAPEVSAHIFYSFSISVIIICFYKCRYSEYIEISYISDFLLILCIVIFALFAFATAPVAPVVVA